MINLFNKPWFVYILVCDDGTLYTGITHNLQNRFYYHKKGTGARYTAKHGAKQILFFEEYPNHREAAVREREIKQLSHGDKVVMVINHIINQTQIHLDRQRPSAHGKA